MRRLVSCLHARAGFAGRLRSGVVTALTPEEGRRPISKGEPVRQLHPVHNGENADSTIDEHPPAFLAGIVQKEIASPWPRGVAHA